MDWVDIKGRWQLTATPSEAEALREMLAGCEEPITLDITRVEQAEPPVAVDPTPAGQGRPAGMSAEDSGDEVVGGDALLYDTLGSDRDAGILKCRRRRSLRWRVGRI